jgi:Peptide N-acetyl-beta-D-glucosaminyl asparaginase amidase A
MCRSVEDTMRLVSLTARRPIVIATAALLVGALGGSVSAVAATDHGGGPDHARRVAPAAGGAPRAAGTRAGAATPPGEFTTTANPVTLDPPVQTPPTAPVVVTIADHAAFGNGPPPATSTVTLPQGHWAEVVLDVTGTETGRQFDRLLEIFDGASQIFLGVTPEPTPAGITWHVQKDITGYLPILAGSRTFSTFVDNFLSGVDTGIPTITAKLLFYRSAGGFRAAQPASLAAPALAGNAIDEAGPATPARDPGVPTQVVPVLPAGATSTLNTVNAGQTLTASVSLPDNVTTAALDLYAVGQGTDEFWWGLEPAFREIEVTIDGKLAGVVRPFPYVYTGGVNPLIWRPLSGIRTLDIPSYRLDLTPFAGLLAGTHTIGLTVVNNAGFWLAGGSLLLTAGGSPTSGRLLSDTLSPTASQVTTSDALGSASQPVTSETANGAYAISGQVTQGGRTWTDTLRQSLQFGDDQSDINPSCSGPCYQWVHGEVTQSTSETVSGPGAQVARHDTASWTIDAPNGFLQNADGSDFFLPAAVSQQLTDVAAQHGGFLSPYRASLSESIIGYGALEEDNSAATISNGDTTGTITDQDSGAGPGALFQRTVVAHGGVIVQDLTQKS